MSLLLSNCFLNVTFARASPGRPPPFALLRGHGNVVVRPNLQVSVRQAIYTEVNAKLLIMALSLGGPVTYISAEEGAAVEKTPGDTARGWELWKPKALGQ